MPVQLSTGIFNWKFACIVKDIRTEFVVENIRGTTSLETTKVCYNIIIIGHYNLNVNR